jgi:hypothetical protein
MNQKSDFDSEMLRQHSRTTSASSHPELLSGDLAVPPRRYSSMTAINRSIAADASRRRFGIVAVVAIVAVLSTVLFKSGTASDDGDKSQKLARVCLHWHLAAGVAVSQMVRSTRDADLQQAADAVARMRRGRQNCDTGSVALACQDYQAVMASLPGHRLTNPMRPCSRVD